MTHISIVLEHSTKTQFSIEISRESRSANFTFSRENISRYDELTATAGV